MSDQYFINRQNKLRELLTKNNLDGMLIEITVVIMPKQRKMICFSAN